MTAPPVLVFEIVRLLSVPPDVEPSIVTLSAPFNLIKDVAAEPEIVRAAPLGLIVTVKPPATSFKATVPVSPVKSDRMLMVIFPVAPEVLMASKMPPALVNDAKVPPVPTV